MALSISIVKRQFAKEFERAVQATYHFRPSNEQLARDFVFFSNYSIKLNRETVRKWRNGATFPDLDHLVRMIYWVGLDVSNVFQNESQTDVATALSIRLSQPHPQMQLSVKQIDLLMQMLKRLPIEEEQGRVH